MSLDLDAVAAQKKKDNEQNALIDALVELSRSCPQYYYKQLDAYIANDLPSAVQNAFSPNNNIIGKLQRDGKLHGYIFTLIDLKNKEEASDFPGKKILAEIRIDVLEAVLRESEKRQEIPSTLHPVFTNVGDSSSFFKRSTLSSNAKYGAIAFGGVLTGVGILTTLALLAKSSAAVSTAVAVMKVAAVGATATSGFPPAFIGFIAVGVTTALLIAAMLAIAAIRHYHNKETRKLVDEFRANGLKN